MKTYTVNELRKMFLEFFESKGHLKLNSFSLIPPNNDKSLLLINSGMAPLKPYFTGQEIPPRRRVTTCQKCIRTGDIENVGKTARHGTFFEMLGNFSFGDYFKNEAIEWSWEFLTEVVGLDKERLYPSVYQDDDEAFDIWNKKIGIAADRISRFGKEDNFWEHGAGPCGPCSEIYYDRGEKYGCGKPDCKVGCDCDRYIEVWNNVFSQFNNDGNGNYTELVQKNIDTGMGLERLATVVQDVDSIFDVDTIKALRDEVCTLAGKTYHENHKDDVSIRVITDHIRSVTFMLSDGIKPSNEGRGYVLRRLLRRALRHGRLLQIEGSFLGKLALTVIESSKDGYPELLEKKDYILNILAVEEENFNKNIDQGLSLLSALIDELAKNGKDTLAGEDAFRLYDTYGFPLDLTKEILEEKGLKVDEAGYDAAMKHQKDTARNAREVTTYTGTAASVYDDLDPKLTSEFVGYDRTSENSVITALVDLDKDEVCEKLVEGTKGTIITEITPFYATMGGQHADTGLIEWGENCFVVEDVIKLLGGRIGHKGYVKRGQFTIGEVVELKVDEDRRADTCKNHSATHLLQAALRKVLGTHVEQHGSLCEKERLRFDFSHFSPMTPDEIRKVEDIVNEMIAADLPVVTKVCGIEEAKKSGAMALFGEKYGDTVRVVSMGDFSVELCGGTHVANTGSIRLFKIVSETGIAAGVRRIEALTGQAVLDYYRELENTLDSACMSAKADRTLLVKKIGSMNDEIKALNQENEKLKAKLAGSAVEDSLNSAVEVAGVKILAARVDNADMNSLRNLGDDLKGKLGTSIIFLAGDNGGKVTLLSMATDDAVAKGANAGALIKQVASIVGGGGGGRPTMAQAGGKNPAGIDECIAKALETAKAQII